MTDKSFYIENLGCAKNQVDAELIIATLTSRGWAYLDSPQEAGIIIVNTCGFIESAKAESIDVSLELRKAYPDKRIIMAGCLAERYADSLKTELPEVDDFAGNRNPADLIRLLEPSYDSHEQNYLQLRKRLLSLPGSSYLKIAEGCSNLCSYCSIPLIRGPLQSRSVSEILEEMRALLEMGIFEYNLIAQDLAAFGTDREGEAEIVSLFRQISRLKGAFWVRPLYIHPDKFPVGIIDVMRDDERFLPYFDLPFQHASGRILTAMNRRGEAARYLELLASIRAALPHAVIRSTFLTGFPGETQADFRLLLDFQQQARLDWLGVFTYSREEDTPAYTYPDRVKPKVAAKRKQELEKQQVAITAAQLERFCTQSLPVLLEEQVQGEELFLGRCYAQAPEVDGLTVVHGTGFKPGQVVCCRILKVNGMDLEAVPV